MYKSFAAHNVRVKRRIMYKELTRVVFHRPSSMTRVYTYALNNTYVRA